MAQDNRSILQALDEAPTRFRVCLRSETQTATHRPNSL